MKEKLIKRVKRSVQAKKIPEFVIVEQISLQNKIVKKYKPLNTHDFVNFSECTDFATKNIK